MSIFGDIISDDEVEDAVVDIQKKWISTYLAEVERQRGIDAGFYERPRTYEVRTDFEKWPEDQLPTIIVISTGLGDDPEKDGGGKIRVPFSIAVIAVVSSVDQVQTRRMAYRYGAAIRALMVQHQTLDLALGGKIRGVDWTDGRNNEMPPEDGRTIWATRQTFTIDTGDALTSRGGPTAPEADPALDPLAPWPDPPEVAAGSTSTTLNPTEGAI